MKRRFKMKKRNSRRYFTKNAKKTNRRNNGRPIQRGGRRL